jgi:hypothetical protein
MNSEVLWGRMAIVEEQFALAQAQPHDGVNGCLRAEGVEDAGDSHSLDCALHAESAANEPTAGPNGSGPPISISLNAE